MRPLQIKAQRGYSSETNSESWRSGRAREGEKRKERKRVIQKETEVEREGEKGRENE